MNWRGNTRNTVSADQEAIAIERFETYSWELYRDREEYLKKDNDEKEIKKKHKKDRSCKVF